MNTKKIQKLSYELYLSWLWLIAIVTCSLWIWMVVVTLHDSTLKVVKLKEINKCLTAKGVHENRFKTTGDQGFLSEKIPLMEDALFKWTTTINTTPDNQQSYDREESTFEQSRQSNPPLLLQNNLIECLKISGFEIGPSAFSHGPSNSIYVPYLWGNWLTSNFSFLLSTLLIPLTGILLIGVSIGVKKFILWLNK